MLPLLSLNPTALPPGLTGQRVRQETHRERQTDSSAEGCDSNRHRQSKVLKVLPSLNDSVHREYIKISDLTAADFRPQVQFLEKLAVVYLTYNN